MKPQGSTSLSSTLESNPKSSAFSHLILTRTPRFPHTHLDPNPNAAPSEIKQGLSLLLTLHPVTETTTHMTLLTHLFTKTARRCRPSQQKEDQNEVSSLSRSSLPPSYSYMNKLLSLVRNDGLSGRVLGRWKDPEERRNERVMESTIRPKTNESMVEAALDGAPHTKRKTVSGFLHQSSLRPEESSATWHVRTESSRVPTTPPLSLYLERRVN